jgi:hypothetical protein
VQLRQLTALLAWAVVFCDIGTSVYYVPDILFHTVGNLAPLFISLTTVGFLLPSLKYIEITWRNPDRHLAGGRQSQRLRALHLGARRDATAVGR